MTEKQYTITESQMEILTTTIKAIYKTKKRKHAEIVTAPEVKKDWTCSGRFWEEPAGPCQPGLRSHIQMRIKHDKRYVVVCKECKLARDRHKNAKKRREKKLKLEPVIKTENE